MDADQAAESLRLAAGQRRRLEVETRRPRWIWAGLFAYVVGLFALEDFAPQAARWVILVIAVVFWIGRLAPGVRLRAAALVGRRAQVGRAVLPPVTRAVLLGAFIVAFVAAFLLLGAKVPDSWPGWLREHRLTAIGVLVACVLTPVAWTGDRLARRRLAGRSRSRPPVGR
jgi:hypothetical protein